MYPGETIFAVGLAGVATAIATGALEVPPEITHSSVTQAFLLIMALVLFAYSPIVGIAAMALFAVIIFNRNMKKTVQYKQALSVYGEDNIAKQPVVTQAAEERITSQPREYTQFRDTYEGYQTPTSIGQYPLDEPRPSAQPTQFDYVYRPGPDMGSDAFERLGPNIDHKAASFAY
jgi:hypothetical protein